MLGGLPESEAALTERLTATPAGVSLGPLDLIEDGKARGFVLEMRAGRFHGFVVRRGDAVHGYVDRCPHLRLPLAQQLDDYVHGEHIVCSWHGAIFAVEDGKCLAGPCVGSSLSLWRVTVHDGRIMTV